MAIHLNILLRKYKESRYDIISIKCKTSEVIYRLQNPVSEKMHAHSVIRNMYCSIRNRKSETQHLIKESHTRQCTLL